MSSSIILSHSYLFCCWQKEERKDVSINLSGCALEIWKAVKKIDHTAVATFSNDLISVLKLFYGVTNFKSKFGNKENY